MVAPAKPSPLDHSDDSRDLPLPDGAAVLVRLERLLPGLRLLVVDPDPATAPLVRKALAATQAKTAARRTAKCTDQSAAGALVYWAANLAEASRTLRTLVARGEAIDLVIAEERQPDGRGLALSRTLAEYRSESRLLVTSFAPTLAGSLEAFRKGALDYLPKPLSAQTLAQQIRIAAARRYVQLKDQRRLTRLKGAVRQLNNARRTIGKKVDLLCQDLIGAYTDVARQMEQVRVGGHLSKLLASASDLEQMLCHMMDWLLRELGHCNIAIFLTDDEGKSELGAFMKHTIAGDERVTRWLAQHVIPRVTLEGLLDAGDTAAKPQGPADAKQMPQQALMAVDCTYLAESLGTLIVFRANDKPFSGDQFALLKAAGPVFATALTNLVRSGEASPEKKKPRDEDEWWRRSA